jgi:orotate phosphoribosyltransferase
MQAHITREDFARLQELMQRCFKYDGPYTLASGRTSNYYYDGKGATLDPEAAWLIGRAMVDVVLASGAEAVGGPEIGSIPIADAVGLAAHLTRGRHLPTFVVRKQAKGHGTRSQVSEANLAGGEPLLRKGRRVAIVEDTITTGGSVQQAIDVVRELGCDVTLVAVIVERHESGDKAVRGQGFPVKRIFRTDEHGVLSLDDDFVREAAPDA